MKAAILLITMGVIYKITCKTSKKSYVGQTKHTSKYRWHQHIWEACNPKANQSRKLNNAIRKYEPDDFVIEDLFYCDDEELDLWEMFYIEECGTFLTGYNLTKGGKNNMVVSDETRKKLSEALRGKPKNVKNNRKREEDNWLPKYFKHYVDEKGSEGYRVCDHPGLNGGSVSSTRSDKTMEEKFIEMMKILDSLNAGTYVLEKKKEPKGVQPIPNGYRVRVKGYPVRTFQKKKLSMEQKLEIASAYAESIYKGVQFND